LKKTLSNLYKDAIITIKQGNPNCDVFSKRDQRHLSSYSNNIIIRNMLISTALLYLQPREGVTCFCSNII